MFWRVSVSKAACAVVGVTAKGPGSREQVTFLAHDPVSTAQRVLVTVVGGGRDQFDGQHCLNQRNKVILRGRRRLTVVEGHKWGLSCSPAPEGRGARSRKNLG